MINPFAAKLRNSVIILLTAACIITSCNSPAPKKYIQLNSNSGKLIQINYADSNYTDLQAYLHDTVTNDGWKIQYLVKDNQTKYNDIYIQWSKGNKLGLYCGADMLEMRRYFIPVFAGENNNHIFLTHGCATECAALLTLSKDSMPTSRDFAQLIKFNTENGQIVYIPSENKKTRGFEVAVYDLNKKIEKLIPFINLCPNASYLEGCIDSIYFSKSFIEVSATLMDKNDIGKTKIVREQHTIVFSK